MRRFFRRLKYLLKTSFKGVEKLDIFGYKIRDNGIIVSLNVYVGLLPSSHDFFLNNEFFEEYIIPEIRDRKLKQLLSGEKTNT